MYLSKIYDPGAFVYRVRYAIANIMRDRIVNEGAFKLCFEMDGNDEVVRTILRRGLKNPKLRAALEESRLINLTRWLILHPEYSEAYHRRTISLTKKNVEPHISPPARTTRKAR
jgi:hypothetical protein